MKNRKIIFLLISILIVISFIIYNKNMRSNSSNKFNNIFSFNRKNNISSNEELDLSNFIVENHDNTQFKNDKRNIYNGTWDTERSMPDEIEGIIKLIRLGKYNEALELLKLNEKNLSNSEESWNIFFKAHIYFLQRKYHFSLKFFKLFIEKYPNHEFISNAQEAVKFING
jgi:tetratricopeptide (TPR) repeat protein